MIAHDGRLSARAVARVSGLAACLVLLGACSVWPRGGRRESPLPRLARTVADSVSSETLAPGVVVHRLVNIAAPWRASVLDIDLTTCVSLRSVKGGDVALGRRTTTALLAGIDPAEHPLAAVNADFFLFTPPGVPVGAHVERGRLLAGPIDRPVFAMTRDRRPWIGKLTVTGRAVTSRGEMALTTWNRPSARATGVVDAHWGMPLDTLVARTAWLLAPVAAAAPRAGSPRYVATPLSRARDWVLTGDTLLLVGVRVGAGAAPVLVAGDTVRVERALAPIIPTEVVGANPVLLRDSIVAGAVDSVNDAAFRGLNPRTAAGYADRGRRVMLMVIDGRQPGYSMGMSLRNTASLFRALGATDAVNLDGGGSSAMLVTDARAAGGTRRVTHPSDSAGERPVANALAVVRGCR